MSRSASSHYRSGRTSSSSSGIKRKGGWASADEQLVKIVLVGDGAVGKTSMLVSYTTGSFPNDYVPTVFDNCKNGDNNKKAKLTHAWIDSTRMVLDQCPIALSLWDTAGQEDYDKMRLLSYPETDAFLVCYSVMSQTSFHNVKQKWLPELCEHVHNRNVPFILVGTKADLRRDKEQVYGLAAARNEHPVTMFQAQDLAEELGAYSHLECSALTQEGLHQVFQEAIEMSLGLNERRRSKFANSKAKPSGFFSCNAM